MYNIARHRRRELFEKRARGFRPSEVAVFKARVVASLGQRFWREEMTDAQRSGLVALWAFDPAGAAGA